MVELKNVTSAMLGKVIAADSETEDEAIERYKRDEYPWPDDWKAMKDLTVENAKLLEWLTEMLNSLKERKGVNPAFSAPVILRAVILGYNLAKEQMTEELLKGVVQ